MGDFGDMPLTVVESESWPLGRGRDQRCRSGRQVIHKEVVYAGTLTGRIPALVSGGLLVRSIALLEK